MKSFFCNPVLITEEVLWMPESIFNNRYLNEILFNNQFAKYYQTHHRSMIRTWLKIAASQIINSKQNVVWLNLRFYNSIHQAALFKTWNLKWAIITITPDFGFFSVWLSSSITNGKKESSRPREFIVHP